MAKFSSLNKLFRYKLLYYKTKVLDKMGQQYKGCRLRMGNIIKFSIIYIRNSVICGYIFSNKDRINNIVKGLSILLLHTITLPTLLHSYSLSTATVFSFLFLFISLLSTLLLTYLILNAKISKDSIFRTLIIIYLDFKKLSYKEKKKTLKLIISMLILTYGISLILFYLYLGYLHLDSSIKNTTMINICIRIIIAFPFIYISYIIPQCFISLSSSKNFSYSFGLSNINYTISRLIFMAISTYLTDVYIKPLIIDIVNPDLLNNRIKRDSLSEFIKTADIKKMYNNYMYIELRHTDIETIVFFVYSVSDRLESNKVNICFKSILNNFYSIMAGKNSYNKTINNYCKPFLYNRIPSTLSMAAILNPRYNLTYNQKFLYTLFINKKHMTVHIVIEAYLALEKRGAYCDISKNKNCNNDKMLLYTEFFKPCGKTISKGHVYKSSDIINNYNTEFFKPCGKTISKGHVYKFSDIFNNHNTNLIVFTGRAVGHGGYNNGNSSASVNYGRGSAITNVPQQRIGEANGNGNRLAPMQSDRQYNPNHEILPPIQDLLIYRPSAQQYRGIGPPVGGNLAAQPRQAPPRQVVYTVNGYQRVEYIVNGN